MKLTADEIKFLESQGLSQSDVFDTSGRSPAKISATIKKAGKTLALHTPCAKGGHRLKSRYGHCVQCNPAYLAYSRRHEVAGECYVAVSSSTGLVKIGFSTDVEARDKKNSFDGYAGARDWRTVFIIEADGAARIESLAQSKLRLRAVAAEYERDGHPQVAREAFRCSALQAVNAIVSAAKELGIAVSSHWKDAGYRW